MSSDRQINFIKSWRQLGGLHELNKHH